MRGDPISLINQEMNSGGFYTCGVVSTPGGANRSKIVSVRCGKEIKSLDDGVSSIQRIFFPRFYGKFYIN
jgi:hypothetical protein